MNSKRDFDRAVDQWLDEGLDATPPEVIDAVLLAVRSTPQERDLRVPWRTTSMTLYLRVAAVIALAVIASTAALSSGYQFFSGGSGFGGTNATPSASPALIARGTFVTSRGAVELEATGEGSSATGRMTVSGVVEDWSFIVDLQCTRTTEDGLIMIGGVTTATAGGGSVLSPEGTFAAIVLKRGSPVQATVWSQRGGGTEATSCLAYLDERFEEKLMDPRVDDDDPGPIEGTIELGPGGSGPGGTTATPSPSPALLARGNFVIADGAVEIQATGEGSGVSGRMTVTEAGSDAAFTVDLQCARTTAAVSVAGEQADDGLIMIGGVTTDTTGGGSVLSPEGTWAGIVLKRGSPVETSIWSQRGGPTSEAASCLAYLDEQLMEEPSRNTDGDWLSPIEGTVELGP